MGNDAKVGGTCVNCGASASTVVAEVLSVTFRSDHLDASGKKLIKAPKVDHLLVFDKYDPNVDESFNPDSPNEVSVQIDSLFGNAHEEFKKPEWTLARGAADSHPISHTKNKTVKLDVKIRLSVGPKGTSATLMSVTGRLKSPNPKVTLTFTKKGINKRVKGTQEILLRGLESHETLPNFVTLIENHMISWTAKVLTDAENRIRAGVSGPHTIYVTFARPHGKMASPTDNSFAEIGPDQFVTEPRLRYSVRAAAGTGETDEKECVDAIFKHLAKLGVGYVLDHRWENGKKNNTWVLSIAANGQKEKPSLHHYLWLCNKTFAKGECHNIAAAFTLASRILGVQGAFEVGYMFPWPSRSERAPKFPKRGDGIMGKYNVRYERAHGSHGKEILSFVDGSGAPNNFEGVAKYKTKTLYAIGDAVFDAFGTANENATSYYSERSADELFPEASDFDLTRGGFPLWFVGKYSCEQPYPDDGLRKVHFTDSAGNPFTESKPYFYWEEPPHRP